MSPKRIAVQTRMRREYIREEKIPRSKWLIALQLAFYLHPFSIYLFLFIFSLVTCYLTPPHPMFIHRTYCEREKKKEDDLEHSFQATFMGGQYHIGNNRIYTRVLGQEFDTFHE